MGELHVNIISTLDGVIQANGGPTEQDGDFPYAGWERPFWDAESGAQVDAIVRESDALLLGRTTYDIFRSYWPGRPDEIGRAFDRVPKYVASRGTPELSWDASTQITDVGAGVRDLRERHAQIHTWGSANLLQTLFREALVDRMNLWVCPVVLGEGKRLFPEGTAAGRFEQTEPPESYPGGVLLLRYRRLEGPPETEATAETADAGNDAGNDARPGPG
ncbi:dihydrofolate reductase family protein [Streptomyces sp. YIM 98790]|uniref:dihydrofolate reductase family protein n=1 Tax=Streptomyces sp. YIM 98790 TaxID=2689077 RepID=UPI00140DA56C|nr:dihydrofolate reductase family protein [Streptomyces sp. YIM 98790]